MKRLYCNIAEVIDDLSLAGCSSEAAMMKHIRAASRWIDDQAGEFLPATAAKTFLGMGFDRLFIPPLLSVSSITVDGVALGPGDYDLLPRNKHWEDGPYTCVQMASDGTRTRFEVDEEIVITGTWGLYGASEDTGQTLPGNVLIGDASIAFSDGSKISPGMTLKIESEQLLVTASGAFSDSATNTNQALDSSQETVLTLDGTKVKAGEVLRIDFEQMKCVEVQTNTALAKRGWNQTTRVAHLTNADVYVLRTYAVDRGCNGTVAAAHLATTPISRMAIPDDVNYLAREIAALMLKKAESSFAGRIGNAETGETFYFNELPKDAINRILGHYRIVRP
jgi:hypothetical protein